MMRLCNHAGQLWSYQQESWRKASQNLRELLATDIFIVMHYDPYIHQPLTLHWVRARCRVKVALRAAR